MMKKKCIGVLSGVMLVLACHSGMHLISPSEPESISNWGGNIGRNHAYQTGPDLPLALAWSKKSEGGYGRALSTDGVYCFAGLQNGQLEVFRLKDGHRMFRKRMAHRSDATVAVFEQRILCALRHGSPSLQCFNTLTGETVWEVKAGAVAGEPLLLETVVVIVTEKGRVGIYNMEDGTLEVMRDLNASCWSGASASDEMIFVATHNAGIWALDRNTLEICWHAEPGGDVAAAPTIGKENLYIGMVNQQFCAIDLKNGELQWSKDLHGGVFETAACADGKIYAVTARGVLWALDSVTGNVHWRIDTDSVIGTSPIVAGDKIYFGTLDHFLHAISVRDGHELWTYKLKGRIRTAPLVLDNILIVASEGRQVYAFQSK